MQVENAASAAPLQKFSEESWYPQFYSYLVSLKEMDDGFKDSVFVARSMIHAQKESLPAQCRERACEDVFNKIAIKVAFEVEVYIVDVERTLREGVWKCQRHAVILARVIFHLHRFVLSKGVPGSHYPSGMVNGLDMGLGKTVAASLMLLVSHSSDELKRRVAEEDEDEDDGKDDLINTANEMVDAFPMPESNGASLVFVPPSLIDQWTQTLCNIFGKKAVLVLKNPNANIDNLGDLLEGTDTKVILLSVNMLQNGKKAGLARGHVWLNLVVDEAHIGVGSRSVDCNTKTNAAKIEAVTRIAVTATPDQGDIRYMISLLQFCGISVSKTITAAEMKHIAQRRMIRISREEAKDDIGAAAPPDPEYVTLVVNEDDEKGQLQNETFSRMIQTINQYENMTSTRTMTKISLSRQAVVYPSILFDTNGKLKRTLNNLADQLPSRRDELPEISPVIAKMVDDIISRPASEKHVVMCHFTEELNAVVAALRAANIRSYMFSGETPLEQKDLWILQFRRFQNNGKQRNPVLVCNIQCGSVGLNLQCAHNIYFPTSDWNHQRELQAVARLHRSGQKNSIRVVFVRHYLDTTDENIQAVQYRKILHCNNVLGESRDVERHIQRLQEGQELAKRKSAEALLDKEASPDTPPIVTARKKRLPPPPPADNEEEEEDDDDGILIPLENAPRQRQRQGRGSRGAGSKRKVVAPAPAPAPTPAPAPAPAARQGRGSRRAKGVRTLAGSAGSAGIAGIASMADLSAELRAELSAELGFDIARALRRA